MPGRNGLLAASAVLIAATAWCDDALTQPPSASELRNWVAELNHDDYAVREEAARRLTKAGPAAIADLVEGLASDQAEVAWRCGAALEQIGLAGDDATVEQIVKHLDAACAKTGRTGLKSLATDLHARQRQFRRERAVAAIRKQGGQISGSGFDGGMEAMLADPFGPVIVFDGPVVIEDFAPDALAVPVPEVEALPRAEVFDLFGEIGRVMAKVLLPGGGDKEGADEPAMEGGGFGGRGFPGGGFGGGGFGGGFGGDAFPGGFGGGGFKGGRDAAPDTEPDAKAIDEAAADEAKLTDEKPAEEKPAEAPAPPVVEASEPAPVDAIEVVGGRAVALAEVDFAEVMVAAGAGAALDGEWAQLALDSNWRGGDDGLAVLKDLPELAQIDLNQTKLSDKALVHLAKLPKLRQLNLHRAGFSRDALLKFHGQRPGLVIYARGDAMMGIHGDLSSSPLVLTTVQEGSGAARAGLQEGDLIHHIDGVKIRDFSDLTICVAARQPGEKIEVQYEREGKKRTVQVSLSRRIE
ncbi:MAG TPA: PDZ domain-containing protein [Pirellulaceae bacterium]|nr:PDZ domain-containing protein [Pirellulaceae bacterium]